VKCYSLEDSKSPPIPFSIFFLTVPWEVLPLGIPLSLTAVGVMRMTRWGLVHRGPNGEGRRSFRRRRSPGLTEIVTGWGRTGLRALWEVPWEG
jgi:hypothetical protein